MVKNIGAKYRFLMCSGKLTITAIDQLFSYSSGNEVCHAIVPTAYFELGLSMLALSVYQHGLQLIQALSYFAMFNFLLLLLSLFFFYILFKVSYTPCHEICSLLVKKMSMLLEHLAPLPNCGAHIVQKSVIEKCTYEAFHDHRFPWLSNCASARSQADKIAQAYLQKTSCYRWPPESFSIFIRLPAFTNAC